MDNQTNTKPKARAVDRVALSHEAQLRLVCCMNELSRSLKGCRISKGDLVNYIILSHPPTFSGKECDELREKHFDELRFAEWAVKQIKAAKSSGEAISLSSLFDEELQKTSK